jgi:hypothetical protein
MTVKVYRENNEVIVSIIVTNYKQDKIVERVVKVKNVSANVMETLQYKTAVAAKNEFEAYLDAAFGGVGEVVQEARAIPPKPKEPFVMPDFQIDGGLQLSALAGGSSRCGWELAGISPFLGLLAAERFRVSVFGGGGISIKKENEWMLYWTYNLGGDLDFLFDKHIVNAGAGIEGSNSSGKEKQFYPFIRIGYGFKLLEDIFYEDILIIKFYGNYNFNGNGFKLGVLFIFYEYRNI